MSLLEHAKRELNADVMSYDGYDAALTQDVLELIETFAKQGHSGSSANIVRQLFHQLSAHEPLSPLTGKDNEWEETSLGLLQNKRDFAVFKDKKTNVVYYIDAIVWIDEKGNTFTNKQSALNIAHFPFTPKTFHIAYDSINDVIVDTSTYEKAKEYYQCN